MSKYSVTCPRKLQCSKPGYLLLVSFYPDELQPPCQVMMADCQRKASENHFNDNIHASHLDINFVAQLRGIVVLGRLWRSYRIQ